MQRPPQLTRRDIPADDLGLYDRVIAQIASLGGVEPTEDFEPGAYFSPFLNSLPMASGVLEMIRLIIEAADRDGGFSQHDREFANQILFWESGYYFFLPGHTRNAVRVGVRLDAIEAIRDEQADDLTGDERQLAAYVRAVRDGTVTDEQYAAMQQRLGARGLVEYTIFIANVGLTIRLAMAFGLPAPSRAELDQLVASFRLPDASVPG